MGLIKELKKGEFNYEGKIFVTLFDKEIDIEIEPDVDMDYAQRCVEHLNHLQDEDIDMFCHKAMQYYQYMLEEWKNYDFYDDVVKEIEKTIPKNISGRDILKYIHPYCLYIEKPQEDIPAFVMGCDCVWEPEHDLQWIQRGHKVLQVATFDSVIGPWADDEDYKVIWD